MALPLALGVVSFVLPSAGVLPLVRSMFVLTYSCGLGLPGLKLGLVFKLGRSHPISASFMSSGIPWILQRSLQNWLPWTGLVKWSANMSFVGKCLMVISPAPTRFLIKNISR
jgi:hypothetical protein